MSDATTTYDVTEAYLFARIVADEAAAALKAAEAEMRAVLEDTDGEFVETSDGTRVMLVRSTQRVIDPKVLAEYLPLGTFDKVTETKVVLKAFDAAVALGDVPAEVADKATTVKDKAPALKVVEGVRGVRR